MELPERPGSKDRIVLGPPKTFRAPSLGGGFRGLGFRGNEQLRFSAQPYLTFRTFDGW